MIRRVALAGLCALPLLALSGAPARGESSAIEWRSGARELPAMSRDGLREALADLGARADHRRVVLRTAGPLDAEARAQLKAGGVRLLRFLGRDAWFATLESGLDADGLAVAGKIVALSSIDTIHKLHPDLARGEVPDWSRLQPKPSAGLDPDRTYVALYVHRHADAGALALAQAIGRNGGGILTMLTTLDAVVAWLPVEAVESLAAEDDVMFVEPPLPALTPVNDQNRVTVGADTLQASPYDLDGSGVSVMVYDGGKAFAHADFATRLTLGPSDTSGDDNFHATHVAGTIGGDGAESSGDFRGMAPGVEIISYGFQQGSGTTLFQGFLYTDPGDIEQDYAEAISLGADLSNNSIGTNVRLNGSPCDWMGDYETTGAVIDAITRGALGQPFTNIWSAGNERGGNQRCGSSYNTTGPSACNKNAINVGAINAEDESTTGFTSFGPCDDGRLKPTVSAPGCQGDDDFGVTSTATGGGYDTFCGTSMAAPTTTGVAALMLEQYRLSFPATPDPLPSTMRAIFVQTAQDLETTGPDYKTGYGGIRGVAAIDLIQQGRFFEDEIGPGEVVRVSVAAAGTEPSLRVTLAWDDPPAVPNVVTTLVNDLDLRVVDPGGTVHHPWTLDPAMPGNAAVRTVKDALNNLEQVVIDTPSAGTYLVEITGFDVAEGPTQRFSVAASLSPVACDAAGTLLAGAQRVDCDATLDLRVTDCDLDTNPGSADAAAVAASSTTEPGGETALLTETGNDTGVFSGTLTLGQVNAAGVLQVADGDTLTLTYTDADDGRGGANVDNTVLLTADCSAPLVGSVSVTDIGAGRATVSLTTDSPVLATVHYGTVCGSPTGSLTGLNLASSHGLELTDLVPDTSYLFHLEITDDLGRTTLDDNGAACYAFDTLPAVFLASQFSSGEPGALSNRRVTFTPDGSLEYYSVCGEDAAGFVGPIGQFVEDDTITVVNANIGLYGVTYPMYYVTQNGYIVFDSQDEDLTPNLLDHYDHVRIAGMFQWLDPANSTFREAPFTGGRAATWETQDTAGNQHNFQIELFEDGRIRITWLDMDDMIGVVGLSDGNGLDPAFAPTDFTSLPACPPRPPHAFDFAAATDQDVPVALSLRGDDDGSPAPLSYRIESLPAVGTLSVGGLTIVSTPYALEPGVSSIDYTPAPGFVGMDSFDYRADDGGSAPDGGLSGIATATVTMNSTIQPVGDFLVDDLDPGWSVQGLWAFGQPQGVSGDPTSGFTGNNVFGYNLAGAYAFISGTDYVTTGPIDISGVTNMQLEYRSWLRLADSNDSARIQASNDGSSWTTLWQVFGSVGNTSWDLNSHDLSAFSGSPQLYLRWGLGPTSLLGHDGGWNVDDIVLTGFTTADCDTGDPTVTRIPIAIRDVQVDGAGTVSWQDQVTLSGSATAYELIAADLAFGPADPAPACLQNTTASSYPDATVPAAGQTLYYLVRGWNACGGGSFGSSARDAAYPDTDMDGPSDVCDP